MGYSYDALTGRLCCDACPAFTGVRKRKCPWNCCPAAALCKACWETKYKAEWKTQKFHPSCESFAKEFAEREAKKAAMLADGKYLRCSALGKDNGVVHVIFRGKDSEVGYYMAKETYRAFPLLDPVTPEDFAAIGTLTPAPSEFYRE